LERIVECVPNFSEGRRPEVIARLVEAVESVEGAAVLDTHVDADHNRSVITFVGGVESIVEAAVRVAARAAELIDSGSTRASTRASARSTCCRSCRCAA
jgi:glutamate formiminotransferase